MAIVRVLLEPVCSLVQSWPLFPLADSLAALPEYPPLGTKMYNELPGSNRTHTMAKNRLGNYTGKEKHTA